MVNRLPGMQQPEDDREKLNAALRAAAESQLQLKYATEFVPLLRDGARACVAYNLLVLKLAAMHADFTAVGFHAPAPSFLIQSQAASMVEFLEAGIEAKLLDAHDVLVIEALAVAKGEAK